MHSVEIPQKDWSAKLDQFSKDYAGWLVTLEIALPSMGTRREFRWMPLVGVTADSAAGMTISIAVAEATGEHVTHLVSSPRRVVIQKTASGDDVALEVVDYEEIGRAHV